MDRRDALRRLGLALAAGGLGGVARKARAAARPGAGEGSASAIARLGVQLYTVRDRMAESVPATLERVAEVGYREVEFAGYFGHTAAQIRGMLASVGLAAPSTHVQPRFEADAWRRIVDEAAEAGHDYVIVPSLPEAMRADLDAWRRTAATMNRAGETARAAGLRYGYHNHAGEFVEMEGKAGFDVLLEETDPELVSIQLDLYWTLEAGHDPVAVMERWPGRVESVHVKGRAEDGAMVDVGAGAVDWRRLLGDPAASSIRHYFVEHDWPEDGSFRSIEASYRYMSRLTLG